MLCNMDRIAKGMPEQSHKKEMSWKRDNGQKGAKSVSGMGFIRGHWQYRDQCESTMPWRTGHSQLSQFDRGRIIGMLEAGLSQREVARRLGCSRPAVKRWWDRFQETRGCKRKDGSGRPRLSDGRDDRYLVQYVKRHRFLSVERFRQQWRQACNIAASRSTINKRLVSTKLRSYRPAVRIPLGPAHKAAWVQWCQEHADWTEDQWRSVMWSDESRFCMDFHDGRIRVRRMPSERFVDGCMVEHDHYGGGSVMMWWEITATGRTALIRVNGMLTGQRYVDEILPTVAEWFQRHPGLLLQQDNARPHTARVSMQYLQQHNIPVLPWPARSPDLSPIEHLWDVLGRRIREEYEEPAATLDQLAQWLTDQWNQVPQAEIAKLTSSMPRRVQACLQKRGGHTRY